MAGFVVETYTPRRSAPGLPDTAARARAVAEALQAGGTEIAYICALFVPGDEMCLHLFEADSADAVLEVAAGAGIDHERIVEVVAEPGHGRPPGAAPGAGRRASPSS